MALQYPLLRYSIAETFTVFVLPFILRPGFTMTSSTSISTGKHWHLKMNTVKLSKSNKWKTIFFPYWRTPVRDSTSKPYQWGFLDVASRTILYCPLLEHTRYLCNLLHFHSKGPRDLSQTFIGHSRLLHIRQNAPQMGDTDVVDSEARLFQDLTSTGGFRDERRLFGCQDGARRGPNICSGDSLMRTSDRWRRANPPLITLEFSALDWPVSIDYDAQKPWHFTHSFQIWRSHFGQ